ncbi:MAG: hypothetical protein ACRDM7_20605, partial [Thermoleophilaceae bacterium]
AGVSPTAAGRGTALTLAIERPDGHARLRSLRISLPPGLVGSLAAVAPCALELALAAACPDSSRVGSATALAGTGATPAALAGAVYLTGPVGTAPAGLAVSVAARVGPIDLGSVVTLAEIHVRPADVGIDVVTRDIPQIHEGVPIALRRLELRLDGQGFLRNATSCAPAELVAEFTGTGGEQARDSAPYQPSGCDNLPFAPELELRADRSGRGPALRSILKLPDGHANARRLVVTLPNGIGPNLEVAQRACTPERFAASRCPEAAQIGSATVQTPLLSAPLSGPVVLLMQPGKVVLGLAILLRGQLPLVVRGGVEFSGSRLQTVFDGLPDVPLSRFELTLDGGGGGALVLDRALCKRRGVKARAGLTAHSGATRNLRPPLRLAGCRSARRPRASATLRLTRGGRALLKLRVNAANRRLEALRLTLPKALQLAPNALSRATRVRADGRRGAGRFRGREQALTIQLPPGRPARRIALTVLPDALRTTRKLQRGDQPTLRLRLTPARGQRVNLRTRATVR